MKKLKLERWTDIFAAYNEESKGLSPRTIKIYRRWITLFKVANRGKEINQLTGADGEAFLNDLRKTGKSQANRYQAYIALRFLFARIIKRGTCELSRANPGNDGPRKYTPVIPKDQAERLIARLDDPCHVIAGLMYGCGLQVKEAASLRIRDIDLARKTITVRNHPKTERRVPVPTELIDHLRHQQQAAIRRYSADIECGYDGVFMPEDAEESAAIDLDWFWLFPAPTVTCIAETQELRRYHLHVTAVQKTIRQAARKMGIQTKVTPAVFRASFAYQARQRNMPDETLQAILGHSDIRTTRDMIKRLPKPERTGMRITINLN